MKRHLSFAVVCLSLTLFGGPRDGVCAQDAVAAAAREEIAESLKTLSARIERLEESNHSYQTRIEKLERENYRLRDELDRQKTRNDNAATMDKITRLQDAIKQVDEARLDDNKKVFAEIAKFRTVLEKTAKGLAAPPPPVERERERTTPPPNSDQGKVPENGYKYAIKKGDTLMGIIAALKAEGYKVTRKQMEDANPKVNWDKLQVGKEIFIPPSSP
jgi:LysM repeat protein